MNAGSIWWRAALQRIALTILTSVAGTAARGANALYFVSPTAISGNGTQSRPFGSIAEAISVAGPGDKIYLRGGIYRDKVVLYRDGAPEAPITLSGAPGENAVIDASHLDIGIVIRAAHVIVSNLTVTNSTWWGIAVESSYDTIDNVTVSGSKGAGIYFHAIHPRQVHDDRLINSRIFHNVNSNMGHDDPNLNWDSAVGTYGDKDRILITGILIEKNIVYENQGEGIGCYIVDRCIVRNNIVHDNFSVNLYSDDATNSVFECNYVYTSGNLDYFRNARPAVGIEVADEVPDNPSHSNVFRDNLVVGTTQPFRYGNYGVPVGLQDVRVYGNVFVALPGYTAVSIDRAAHHDTVFSENALVGGVPDNIPGILFRNNTVATSLPLDQPPPCLSKSARNDADPSHGHPHLTKLSVH